MDGRLFNGCFTHRKVLVCTLKVDLWEHLLVCKLLLGSTCSGHWVGVFLCGLVELHIVHTNPDLPIALWRIHMHNWGTPRAAARSNDSSCRHLLELVLHAVLILEGYGRMYSTGIYDTEADCATKLSMHITMHSRGNNQPNTERETGNTIHFKRNQLSTPSAWAPQVPEHPKCLRAKHLIKRHHSMMK